MLFYTFRMKPLLAIAVMLLTVGVANAGTSVVLPVEAIDLLPEMQVASAGFDDEQPPEIGWQASPALETVYRDDILRAAWLRTTLVNPTEDTVGTRLTVTGTRVSRAKLLRYNPSGALLGSESAGFAVPHRRGSRADPTFEVNVPPDSTLVIYLLVTSRDSLLPSLQLRSADAHAAHQLNRDLTFGACFGVLLILGLYNLLAAGVTRDRAYLALAIWLLVAFCLQIVNTGYAFALFWPDKPMLNQMLLLPTFIAFAFATWWFCASFLEIERTRLSRRLAAAVTMADMVVLPLSVNQPNAALFTVLIAVNAPLVFFPFWIAMRSALAHDSRAIRFLLACSPLAFVLLLGIVNRSTALSIDPTNMQLAIGISTALAALGFAMLLAVRIKNLSEERLLAQADALTAEFQAREAGLEADMARKESEAKSLFLATMSHEIRTPMNGVLGMAELMEETDLDEQQRFYLSTLQRSGRGLMGILNDVLDYSKAEAGKIELDATDIGLAELLDEVIALHSEAADRKALEVITQIDASVPERVCIDGGRLKQVLNNLVSNAVKFSPDGEIQVGVSQAGENLLRFRVQDEGIGISAEALPNLFDQFRQADSSISRQFGGTGLGLAISRKLVGLMGGTISVQSEENVGTTFEFTVCYEAATSNAPPPPEPSSEQTDEPLQGVDILVAEDNATNRLVVGKMLSRWGANVRFAVNGAEAVDLLVEAHEDISLVLMDCEMPEMDGYQATECIRAMEASSGLRPMPICALTAHAIAEFRNRAEAAGMNAYVTKPVDRAHLLEEITRLLR